MIDSLYDMFRHWSSKGSVYIISDTHFNDNDCKLMDSNWLSPEEHINLINKSVTKNDTLIILGDIGDINCAKRLKGYKVLIMGNHDQSKSKFKDVFNEIYEGPLFISSKILLSHEPIYGNEFYFNIHGHDHNKQNKGDSNHLNVASNVCGYVPINLGAIIKDGLISNIKSIHRVTIDYATEHKIKRQQ